MAEIAILRRKPQSSEVVPHERTELLDEGASTTDTGRAGRIGLWALAIGFGGFLLWAALAPLDEKQAESQAAISRADLVRARADLSRA